MEQNHHNIERGDHQYLTEFQQNSDDQMSQLMNQPYIQRALDLFQLIHEKFRHQPAKYQLFKENCKFFDKEVEKNYQEPLLQIFKLLSDDSNLTEMFVSLLPKQFAQRMFPHVGQKLVEEFDNRVKQLTDPATYDAYHEIVLDHMNGKTSVEMFRMQIFELFNNFPEVHAELTRFFISNENHAPQQQQPIGVVGQPLEQTNIRPTTSANHVVQEGGAPQTGKNKKDNKVAPTITDNRGDPSQDQANQDENSQMADQSQTQAPAGKERKQNQQQLQRQPSSLALQQAQPVVQAVVPHVPRVIPEILKKSNFAKTDIQFFTEQIPDHLTDQNPENFMKLFFLYLDGVLTQYEFLDMVKELFVPNSEDLLKHLENLISLRDKSRREGNQLLMPVSMIDIGQHGHSHHSAKKQSYFKLPSDYYLPVCSGKLQSQIAKDNLNEDWVCMDPSTGNYNAKVKNVHEDNLFKNEDEIYQIDFKIHKIDNLNRKLELEYENSRIWSMNREQQSGSLRSGNYRPKYLKECHYDFIFKWYSENLTFDNQNFKKQMIENSVSKIPLQFIRNLQGRFQEAARELRKKKQEKIPEWKNLCRANFFKSLDHRSFFFKNKQKDFLPIKKQLEELQKIASSSLRLKSLNQLRGGSGPNHPFYNTYSSFKLNEVCVYSEKDLQAETLTSDSPINLSSDDFVRANKRCLPHMRFLLNDKSILQTTFLILISGPQVGGSITMAEKGKIEDCLEVIINKFFKLDKSFKALKAMTKEMSPLGVFDFDQLLGDKVAYYKAEFQSKVLDRRAKTASARKESEAKATDADKKEQSAPKGTEDKAGDDRSDYSSDQEKYTTTNAAAQALLINLQTSTEDERDHSQSNMLVPEFKKGYSLLFGSSHFYIVFKMISSIYERLIKARQLITERVEDDLSKEEIVEGFKMENGDKIPDELLCSLKKELIEERFEIFQSAVIGTLSQTPHKKLDTANYEDIVRNLMGAQAYLLFVFDKLIAQTLRDLPKLKAQDDCQKSLKLYNSFMRAPVQSEHHYLTQFQSKMQTVNNFNGQSIRLLYSPLSGILCLHLFNMNPYSNSLTTTSGNNQVSQSNATNTQTILSFKPLEEDKRLVMLENLTVVKVRKETSNQHIDEILDETKRHKDQDSDGEVQLKWPVFLNRNKRRMKEARKHLLTMEKATKVSKDGGKLLMENGLIMRQVPMIRKLQFESNTGDYMIYKRSRVAEQDGQQSENMRQIKNEYEKKLMFNFFREAKMRKQQSSEEGIHNDDKMSSDFELNNQASSSSQNGENNGNTLNDNNNLKLDKLDASKDEVQQGSQPESKQ